MKKIFAILIASSALMVSSAFAQTMDTNGAALSQGSTATDGNTEANSSDTPVTHARRHKRVNHMKPDTTASDAIPHDTTNGQGQ